VPCRAAALSAAAEGQEEPCTRHAMFTRFNSRVCLLCCCCCAVPPGCKTNNVSIVYTPWANLKKTASMDVGQV
jgi:hypothetical protein